MFVLFSELQYTHLIGFRSRMTFRSKDHHTTRKKDRDCTDGGTESCHSRALQNHHNNREIDENIVLRDCGRFC